MRGPRPKTRFELMSDVEAGTTEFLIVERISDPSGQTYMQTVRLGDGQYLVERRDGARDRHFKTVAQSM
ncbi:hypothetical protein ACGFIF_42230 [Kribbella sp. NPDC049174]|uniref:hypothetical protein n=1 Tax=Kribbella sp. NPDC049174 TaxID=3364112 RepID=UPI0037137A2F